MTALPSATAGARLAELSLSRVFDAPRDLVFEVWTEPKHLVNWWGPNDFTLAHCDIDFRVGGSYRFCMRSPDGEDHWVSGSYREIDPPNRITFAWVREDIEGTVWCENVISVTFAEVDGMTKFDLYQAPFETTELRDQHRGGWTEALERLRKYVTV